MPAKKVVKVFELISLKSAFSKSWINKSKRTEIQNFVSSSV